MTRDSKTVTIFGTSKAVPRDGVFEDALELGRELAARGFVIANGGYGGTMLASAKGAREAGGEVIGVTCAAFGRKGPNEYVSREIATETLDERLKTLVEIGDAYFVLPGGTGTLLELAEVWELKNKRFADADKPIIIVGAYWKELISLVGRADPECGKYVEIAATPHRAVEKLLSSL